MNKQKLKEYLVSARNAFKHIFLHRKKKLALILLALLGVAIILMFLIGWRYQAARADAPRTVGVSFAIPAANELEVDWQDNFTALLDDLGARRFRLVSYWYLHEGTNNDFNFVDLDWQMDEAAKRGAVVNLAVGLRQPRWPECHQPPWAKELFENDKEQWRAELYEYIEAVVLRYRDHPALESWHLENEFYNRNFGECDDFSTERLETEKQIIRDLDSDTPIIITLADQLGFPFFGPKPDLYATSLYRGNYVKYLDYFSYPIPTHFYSAKAALIDLIHGLEIFIHELQLEPWGPEATYKLSDEQQQFYMPVSRMQENLDFAVETGMLTIDMWGSEWWYWRMTEYNDDSQWNVIKDFIAEHQQVN